MRRRRGSDCGVLLDFEEVRRRLHLGTRRDIGTEEIPVDQVIGSMGRAHEFDGCFRPRTDRLRRVIAEIKRAKPNAADSAILVYQVDHAYFVVDGHKRLSLAVEEGREAIDAEVGRFSSRYHVSSGTTMDDIRATEREHQFRQATGLSEAVPEARFLLSDPEGYLDLEESVKAHCYDLSKVEGRLVQPAEGAKHWYQRVFRQAAGIALDSGVARLLTSTTEADRFLLIRQGAHDPMGHGWQIRATFVEETRDKLRASEPGGISATLARATRRRRRPRLLPAGDVDPALHDQDASPARQGTDEPADGGQPVNDTEG